MNAHPFPESNFTFAAPAGQEGKVKDLPVYTDGKSMTSMWKPSPNELAALNEGAAVVLTVVGAVHPPVAVNVYGVSFLFLTKEEIN